MKLIVEMEMPKACRWNEDGKTKRCPIAEWGGACAVTKLFEPFYDNRPSWCPIKGVLPDEHGALIDRNVAFDYINRLICDGCNAETEADCEACIKKGIDEVLYFVKPTIAAERRDDEQIHKD